VSYKLIESYLEELNKADNMLRELDDIIARFD